MVLIRWMLYAPVTAILPGFQIWLMLLARYMGWWPGQIIWFDWLGALILPGYAAYQAAFG